MPCTRLRGTPARSLESGGPSTEDTDRPYPERLARQEELARANEIADAERRYGLDELHRIEEQRLYAAECNSETQLNRELLNQIERMKLSPHQRTSLQANTVLAQITNPYPHNLSQSLVTRSPVAHQFLPGVVRDVARDRSRDAT